MFFAGGGRSVELIILCMDLNSSSFNIFIYFFCIVNANNSIKCHLLFPSRASFPYVHVHVITFYMLWVDTNWTVSNVYWNSHYLLSCYLYVSSPFIIGQPNLNLNKLKTAGRDQWNTYTRAINWVVGLRRFLSWCSGRWLFGAVSLV